MKLVIVTGMSGAGKGTAVKIMEDMGYYSPRMNSKRLQSVSISVTAMH